MILKNRVQIKLEKQRIFTSIYSFAPIIPIKTEIGKQIPITFHDDKSSYLTSFKMTKHKKIMTKAIRVKDFYKILKE